MKRIIILLLCLLLVFSLSACDGASLKVASFADGKDAREDAVYT